MTTAQCRMRIDQTGGGGTRTTAFACALQQPCVFTRQKGLSMYKGTAGSLQCWFGSPIGCRHQTSTPTRTQTQPRTRLGGASSEDDVLFYQHESRRLIRRGAVAVETGGDGNRWWNGTFINTNIPYARMQPHELSITHNKHRGAPPGNQQPIRIIWLGWWEAGSICSHCHQKRASLSVSTHTKPYLLTSLLPVWECKMFTFMYSCSVFLCCLIFLLNKNHISQSDSVRLLDFEG